LLKTAGKKLGDEIKKIKLQAPKIPVIANVNADFVSDPSAIELHLIEQVSRPVLWEMSMKKAYDAGFRNFLEVGSGSVLSGLAGKILLVILLTE
jgi:[acyl-carrier-protein] S-malonyltransferase